MSNSPVIVCSDCFSPVAPGHLNLDGEPDCGFADFGDGKITGWICDRCACRYETAPKTIRPALSNYKSAVSAVMVRLYAITVADAGIDDDLLERAMEDGDSPEDFARWFGVKYDLDEVDG